MNLCASTMPWFLGQPSQLARPLQDPSHSLLGSTGSLGSGTLQQDPSAACGQHRQCDHSLTRPSGVWLAAQSCCTAMLHTHTHPHPHTHRFCGAAQAAPDLGEAPEQLVWQLHIIPLRCCQAVFHSIPASLAQRA